MAIDQPLANIVELTPPAVPIGTFLIAPCLVILWRDALFTKRGVSCNGVCVAAHWNPSTAKPSAKCEFEFTAADGQVARIMTTAHNRPPAEVGETRSLLYLPSKPQNARVATDLNVGSALFGLVGMAVFTAFAVNT